MKQGNAVLVIDGRTRRLQTFVASATQAQADNPYLLVLRHALDLGNFKDLPRTVGQVSVNTGTGERMSTVFNIDMPVILMGEYTARSSAGRVAVHGHDLWRRDWIWHREVLVVGGLGPAFGKGGLKVLGRPIIGTLIPGPVEVEALAGPCSSNCASADAAWEGVKMLASVDRKAVFLVEGQSDYTYVVRLHSTAEDGPLGEFPPEFREAMFSVEHIVRRVIYSAAYHDLARSRDDGRPSDEEVKAAVKNRLEAAIQIRMAHPHRHDWTEGLWPSGIGLNRSIGRGVDLLAAELGVVPEVPPPPAITGDFVEVEADEEN